MIIHILKDGTRLDSIKGHVVKIEDAAPAYDLINAINAKRVKSSRKNQRGLKNDKE